MIRISIVIIGLFLAFSCNNHRVQFELINGLYISQVTIISKDSGDYQPFNGYVVVDQGKIIYKGKEEPVVKGNYQQIDGQHKYLIPGLIDSHVHANEVQGMIFSHMEKYPDLVNAFRKQTPRSYLYFGYTSLINLGGISAEQLEFFNAQPIKPDLFHTGWSGVSVANGYPMNFIPEEFRFDNVPNFIYLKSEAANIPDRFDPADHTPAAVVERIKEAGGIAVKSYYETGFRPGEVLPVPTREILKDLMEHTHASELVLTVHGNSLKAHQVLSEVGVDVIAHGMWNWGEFNNVPPDSLPPEIKTVLDQQIQKQIGYNPTLTVIEGEKALVDPEFLEREQIKKVVPQGMIEWYKTEEGQWFVKELFADLPAEQVNSIYTGIQSHAKLALKYLSDHGGVILFGTDTPSGPIYTNQPGYNGFWEMKLMYESGVPLDMILASATINNARVFKLDSLIGSIEAGKKANMLLLTGDPLEDIQAYDQIELVILDGKVIERASLSAVN